MGKREIVLVALCVLGLTASAWAVPILQVGVPDGSGGYVNYTTILPDKETAFTSEDPPFTIVVAGIVMDDWLGGQYPTGSDWSGVKYEKDKYFPNEFDDTGAILVVSVPYSAGDELSDYNDFEISVDGGSAKKAFSFSEEPYFPNNHYPVQSGVSDFLYFNIGSFVKDQETVPNFASPSDTAKGDIKTIQVSIGNLQLEWIHFDVIALATKTQGGQNNTRMVTNLENNPGSHDVTWTGGGGPPQAIPEPATMMLVGSGFVGLAWRLRRKTKA